MTTAAVQGQTFAMEEDYYNVGPMPEGLRRLKVASESSETESSRPVVRSSSSPMEADESEHPESETQEPRPKSLPSYCNLPHPDDHNVAPPPPPPPPPMIPRRQPQFRSNCASPTAKNGPRRGHLPPPPPPVQDPNANTMPVRPKSALGGVNTVNNQPMPAFTSQSTMTVGRPQYRRKVETSKSSGSINSQCQCKKSAASQTNASTLQQRGKSQSFPI